MSWLQEIYIAWNQMIFIDSTICVEFAVMNFKFKIKLPFLLFNDLCWARYDEFRVLKNDLFYYMMICVESDAVKKLKLHFFYLRICVEPAIINTEF